MNKFILLLVILMCGNLQFVEAQSNERHKYKITGQNGYNGHPGKALVKTKGSKDWQDIYVNDTYHLYDNDSIKVDSGWVKWSKDNSKSRRLNTTNQLSVYNAWNGIYDQSNSGTAMQGIIVHKGKVDKDSITVRFCFITSGGENTNIIQKTDSLEAMRINHTSSDTLYAYVFWGLSNGQILSMSVEDVLEEVPLVLSPNCDNVFDFKIVVPVTEDKDFQIYLIYSDKKMSNPEKDWSSVDDFKEDIRGKGFVILHTKIEIEQ